MINRRTFLKRSAIVPVGLVAAAVGVSANIGSGEERTGITGYTEGQRIWFSTVGNPNTFDPIGLREDLSSVIYDVTPYDTPFLQSAKPKPSVTRAWSMEDLA